MWKQLGLSLLLAAMGLGLAAVPASAGTFAAAERSDLEVIRRRCVAAHFLSHATFGPTPAGIDALAARMEQIGDEAAMAEWIDQQFTVPATLHKSKALQMISDDGFTPLLSGINHNRYKYHAWWDTAITAPDQLRQRMAWVLAQIFAVDQTPGAFRSLRNDASGLPQYLGIVDYYDMLVGNALGNYRDALQDVSLHPVMGIWLSHVRNRKGDPVTGRFPDENYAREVQQLFTIGLYLLNQNGVYKRNNEGEQIPTYDNETIKSFARVFTGLHYDSGTNFGSPTNLHAPMIMHERFHDTDAKTLLNGTVLPAGQTGMQDISDALDNLFEHENCAPFIARLFIQRLVKSNPSNTYIRHVANAFSDNGSGVRGDLKAVAKAVLLHKEAFDSLVFTTIRRPLGLHVTTRGTEHTHLREPVLRYAGLIRAFNGTSDYPGTNRFMIPDLEYHLNQNAYKHHHVFNFYSPDHRPAGDLLNYVPSKRIPNGALFAPEFEIYTAVAANRFGNRVRAAVIDANEFFRVLNNATHGRREFRVHFDFSQETDLASDPDALMEHLDLLLCRGTMQDSTRQIIANSIGTRTTNTTVRARAAILATLTSPECAIGE